MAQVCPRARRAAVDAGLREVHLGDAQGKYLSDIGNLKEQVAGKWCVGDFSPAYPGDGGESCEQLAARGIASLRRAAAMGKCVLVVAHGGLIKWSAVSIELGLNAPSAETMRLQNVSDVLHAPLVNCCCSTLIYEHSKDAFRAERWFATLTAEAARDDSG